MPRKRVLTQQEVNSAINTIGQMVTSQLRQRCGLFAIREIVQQGFPGRNIGIADIEAIYETALMHFERVDQNQARNSWVAVTGKGFQDCVQEHINRSLNSEGIGAATSRWVREKAPHLQAFLSLPARRRCIQQASHIWPDNDIVLVTKDRSGVWRCFGILSCKTSFHARETEACFWTLATQAQGIKTAVVTLDLDEEFGTCQRPTKRRQLFEMYLDGTYSLNPRTALCSQIKDAAQLIEDIRQWRVSVIANAQAIPISVEEIY
jgi:hypothetical protein